MASYDHLVEALASGSVPIRDLAGLTGEELAHVASAGRAAFETKNFERARIIFAALEALESDRPAHALRRAHCEHALGRDDDALLSIGRYLAADLPRKREQAVEALELRATILAARDPRAGARAREVAAIVDRLTASGDEDA